ncbi:2389_t:CDS:2 [Cetraspora pellucida]|uniref:polynucleotide adenylyltransferase n=1 Tax=Cetraspora pellucida TaxID=1433469 RepID=A0A9N8VNU3_9GLOM|nr:2389_t:CDS:2 [Cetraspora pellucida]
MAFAYKKYWCYCCKEVGHTYANCFLKKSINKKSEHLLSQGALELYKQLLPTEENYVKRRKLVVKIKNILSEEVYLFGSSVNLLGTVTSDVDICVSTPSSELENVFTLSEILQEHNMEIVECVSDAKVPIVKFWDPNLKLVCDVNVNNTIGIYNTQLLRSYVEIDQRIRPLVMIIKHWARQRGLNNAARGTLSSYTWVCIVLNFLQMCDPPILPVLQIPDIPLNNEIDLSVYNDIDSYKGFGKQNQESIGGLLFAFFKCFAYEFDYKSKVISLRQGKFITKREKRWGYWKLCIEEPFDTSRNLGNGINHVSFKRIINEFRRAFRILYKYANLNICCKITYRTPFDDFCDECEQKDGTFFISKKVLKKTQLYLELKSRILGSDNLDLGLINHILG